MFQKLKTFILDSKTEMLENVTWSTYAELQESSILVLVASLIFALLIGLMDFVFKTGLDAYYSSF